MLAGSASRTDGSGTAFPLDATGTPNGVLLGDLPYGGTFYVRFDVTLSVGSYEEIQNCEVSNTAAGTFTRCATNFVATNDWGDLPDTYGTSAAQNGPRHSYNGLKLGSLWDVNFQGIPTAGANGDDLQNQPDEDGVTNTANAEQWYEGNGSLRVIVTGRQWLPECLDGLYQRRRPILLRVSLDVLH